MSKFTKAAKKPDLSTKHRKERVKNFMAGNSFKLNPLDTLKIISTSSIFGEPQYYQDGEDGKKVDAVTNCGTFAKYSIFGHFFKPLQKAVYGTVTLESTRRTTSVKSNITTADIMTKAIDDALDYDFGAVLDFAVELRHTYNMRLNPAIIMVRAAMHPTRKAYTSEVNGVFSACLGSVAKRPDDLTAMVEYYIAVTGDKNKMPSILKRAIAKRLVTFDQYRIAKYQSKGIGLIDLQRIVHAPINKNTYMQELLQTGRVAMPSGNTTWRHLRSKGKSWSKILKEDMDILTHFDIVNQLRSMFSEVSSRDLAKAVITNMLHGVKKGNLFPYRYWVAHKMIALSDAKNQTILLDGLEEAIDKAIENLPILKGRTMILSDNSGSAYGAFSFKGASTTVAEIDNLSAVITGMASEEGYVGVFGNRLKVIPVSKRNGALTQAKNCNNEGTHGKIGHDTENGVWLFFDNAIKEGVHWDNIFIFSDQQAGHGGLYGVRPEDYHAYAHSRDSRYIDVLRLLEEYKKKVNPRVNFFTVQTAGYTNALIPEHIHRGAILSGWTGKEALFANALIEQWDSVENRKTQPKQ